jgi:hypothetical protein
MALSVRSNFRAQHYRADPTIWYFCPMAYVYFNRNIDRFHAINGAAKGFYKHGVFFSTKGTGISEGAIAY